MMNTRDLGKTSSQNQKHSLTQAVKFLEDLTALLKKETLYLNITPLLLGKIIKGILKKDGNRRNALIE